MKFFTEIIQEWWRSIVFLLWLFALVTLLFTRRYVIFLRPEFGVLLCLGILTLAVFLLSGLFGAEKRPASPLEFIRGGILILPLAYLLNSGTQLDSSAFRNRFLGPSSSETTPSVSITGEEQFESSPVAQPPVKDQETTETKVTNATITDLMVAPKQYDGKQVAVVGMVFQSEEFDKIFGENSLVLFRFLVSCCTADSQPVYALIRGKDLPRLPEDSWVKVQGLFKMEKFDQYRVPVINDAVMEKTETPKIPYLF
jgi:uncharacterized repeat protein (TIGR03943 family)